MTDVLPDSPGRRNAIKGLAAAAVGLPTLSVAQASSSKVLRYAFQIAETGMDPAQVVDLYSRILTAHIFEALYDYDHLARPFKIRPSTAAGMPEVTNDFRTYTVRIKPGTYFQDDPAFKGVKRELVAQDYVYSWKRFFDPRWKSPAFATLNDLHMLGFAALREAALKNKSTFDYDTEVDGMRALDRYTLRFSFEKPQPRFIQTMATPDLYCAVAREVVEAYGDDIPAHPVGTGPFQLAEWRRSSKIALVKNPTYGGSCRDLGHRGAATALAFLPPAATGPDVAAAERIREHSDTQQQARSQSCTTGSSALSHARLGCHADRLQHGGPDHWRV
jgi:ABC-type oligopeptide transport system substrate-binding subunit